MISAAEAAVGDAPVLWITGLSGVGKSTLARALVERLRSAGELLLLLDGDEVRQVLDPPEQLLLHDADARRARAWRLARLAQLTAAQSVPVVVATISLYADVQEWNRRSNCSYGEVLMTAPLDTLRELNPSLYGRAGQPGRTHVVGVDLEPEFPREADLTLEQDFQHATLESHLEKTLALWRALRCGRTESA